MVQATPLLLMLFLALGAHGLPHIRRCKLTGQWQNDLGSNMTIYEVNKNGDFTDTITVFTGQCFVDKDGKEVLKTMWLLRLHSEDLANDWKATLVGYNTFWRKEDLMD
ncbi:avidin-like [Zonotrichia leucophrys gambelii]|uniref:avidin-like n=1 Tax=Zonotrichia leucophrys gambelii TaxID=257770 RepID=UPI00313FF738